jgi:hypothetical protein
MQRSIFIHIPKTGGTTLKNIFKQHYSNSMKVISPDFTMKDLLSSNESELNSIYNLYGVIPYGLDDFFPYKMHYLSMLRHPVKRLFSLYRYFCYDKAEGFHKIIPKNEQNSITSFVENIDKYTNIHGNNAQTRLLAGGKIANTLCYEPHVNTYDLNILLKKAKYNVQNQFLFIGSTELFDESIILMKKHLEWRTPIFYLKRNITKNTSANLSKEEINFIKEKNKYDMQLYDIVNQNLRREIHNNFENIKKEKKKLKFNNSVYTFYRNHIRKFIK